MRKQYRLSDAENTLLDLVIENAGGGAAGHLLYPDSGEQKDYAARRFWEVIAEHRGFDPLTIEPVGDNSSLDFTAEELQADVKVEVVQ